MPPPVKRKYDDVDRFQEVYYDRSRFNPQTQDVHTLAENKELGGKCVWFDMTPQWVKTRYKFKDGSMLDIIVYKNTKRIVVSRVI